MTDGVSRLPGRLRFGDYMNGEFREDASYMIRQVEHDEEGVSLILEPVHTKTGFPTEHTHLNVPYDMLRTLLLDHQFMREKGERYPGRVRRGY